MLHDWVTVYLCFQRELQIRKSKEFLSIEEYTSLRRETIGARLVFSHVEYALGIELPDKVYENTVFVEIYLAAADMIWLSNVGIFPSLFFYHIKLTSFCRLCALTK